MSIQYLDRGENEFLISVFIGAIGSWLANITAKLLIYLKIDDAFPNVRNWLVLLHT